MDAAIWQFIHLFGRRGVYAVQRPWRDLVLHIWGILHLGLILVELAVIEWAGIVADPSWRAEGAGGGVGAPRIFIRHMEHLEGLFAVLIVKSRESLDGDQSLDAFIGHRSNTNDILDGFNAVKRTMFITVVDDALRFYGSYAW